MIESEFGAAKYDGGLHHSSRIFVFVLGIRCALDLEYAKPHMGG